MALLFIILVGLFVLVFTHFFRGCVTVIVALALIGWAVRHHPEIIHDFWDLANDCGDLLDSALHAIHEY
jgi:hypothetical protein